MSFAVRIEHWAVADAHGASEYEAPESRPRALVGRVFGHPRKQNGEFVKTSEIVEVIGRRVTTASGTVYLLGQVDPMYADYLLEQGRVLDEDEPIRFGRDA